MNVLTENFKHECITKCNILLIRKYIEKCKYIWLCFERMDGEGDYFGETQLNIVY